MNARRFDRRRLLLAGASFGATFPIVLGYTGVRARQAGAPRICVLGAGDDLSILVTDGPSRLLIAMGTDTTAFGNAFASALPFGLRRIDVVLLAGYGQSAAVALHAARSIPGRSFAIVDPRLSLENEDLLSEPRIEVLSVRRQYQLSRSISVTIEPLASGEQAGWMATIARGKTRVVLLPDRETAALLPIIDPISALIVASGRPGDALGATGAPAVVVSAESAQEADLRDDVATAGRADLLALRVFPGDEQTLAFVDGGLRLPSSARSITASGATERQ